MTEWIESAEEKQRIRETIIQREQGVGGENFELNCELISPLIEQTKILVKRVEQIALDFRKPSIEIGFTHLDGDETYEFYGSANLLKKNKILFVNIGEDLYICWRRISFKLTDQRDKIKVTISEKCSCEKDKNKSYGIREKYKFSISELKPEISEIIINWLVYKISNEEFKKYLPISTNRKSRNLSLYM